MIFPGLVVGAGGSAPCGLTYWTWRQGPPRTSLDVVGCGLGNAHREWGIHPWFCRCAQIASRFNTTILQPGPRFCPARESILGSNIMILNVSTTHCGHRPPCPRYRGKKKKTLVIVRGIQSRLNFVREKKSIGLGPIVAWDQQRVDCIT